MYLNGGMTMYIIPQPQKLECSKVKIELSLKTRLVLDPCVSRKIYQALCSLKEMIQKYWGIELAIVRGKASTADIYFSLKGCEIEQSYEINLNNNEKTVTGSDEEGLFYGIQTLKQIVKQEVAGFYEIHVKDAPCFKNRGYYFDVTRGRIPKLDYLKQIVDRMAEYKLNQLQLYVEHTYMFEGMSEMWRDDTPLTAEEIIELDQYCQDRYVDLVPSMASFGHLYTLLSTYTFSHLCEIKDAHKKPFSFWDRMRHHTLNVSEKESLEHIKKMIAEYMDLFSSKYFNLCADETFDLGKDRSKGLVESKGAKRTYVDFVKELCEYILERGKIPMFWGDIISAFPEYYEELPEETICLNWGYDPKQREDETKALSEASAKQYVCPGVAGWNQWINLIDNSYDNIRLMCEYGQKYDATGVLNTDWGDFGHINNPEFSIPGLIYGAALSWQKNMTERDLLNCKISRLEYLDKSEQWVKNISSLSGKTVFSWEHVVRYYEMGYLENTEEQKKLFFEKDMKNVIKYNYELVEIRNALRDNIKVIDTSIRPMMQAYEVTIEGIIIWNLVGLAIEQKVYHNNSEVIDYYTVAVRLEEWFMLYKKDWRNSNKESDLGKIAKIIFYYADLLRLK
jgi:hypothetical protein